MNNTLAHIVDAYVIPYGKTMGVGGEILSFLIIRMSLYTYNAALNLPFKIHQRIHSAPMTCLILQGVLLAKPG